MTIKAVFARCINCKTEVKEDHEFCTKCGDRMKPQAKPPEPVLIEISSLACTCPLGPEDEHFSDCPQYVSEAVRGRPTASAVQLTPEQDQALGRIADWYEQIDRHHDLIFRLFGPAGTGKTTLVKQLARALGTPNIVYGAYTGKAAHVLRRKGVPATTIHSAIYCPVGADKELLAERDRRRAELERLTAEPAPTGMEIARLNALPGELADLEEALRHGVAFELNPMSEWASADLIVLDEVSMVNERIALDIESFGVPVLVLGDPAQLPPVEGGGYYTNHAPDVLLTEVHRQALESPVLRLATDIRLGRSWADQRVKVDLAEAMAADQILCWKNSTRHNLTAKIREKLGRPAGVPVAGDRVMCLVNNKDIGVFNGQQFEVLGVEEEEFRVRDDDGLTHLYAFDPDGFRGAEGEQEAKSRRRFRGQVGLFTFANVVTVHKAQGSEWDHVYWVDQTEQMWRSSVAEKRALAYTAVTRASERITIAATGV